MNKSVLATALGLSFLSMSAMAADTVSTLEQFFDKDGVVVKEQNYPTLETSRQMLKVQDVVGVNKFEHRRVLVETDKQDVVRMNRDTYYSQATIDVSKGAFITLPEIPAGKYMSLEVITEDHRIQPMEYGAGTYNLTTHTGDYVHVIVRLDSTFSTDEIRKYQDQMQITAKSNNTFESIQVDKVSFDKVEHGLKVQVLDLLRTQGPEATFGMFTNPTDASKELFNKQKYAVGAAVGWGGAQIVDNVYELSPNYPMDQCHQATFADPEDKAFWSITTYDKKGFMFNDLANINSNTAEVNKDGTYTVSFGCGKDAINNLETINDTGMFNLVIRHYIPTDKVKIDGYRILPFVKAM